ncbi:hypothetical protein [Variovorax sp. DAIF25]|uniref:hypothetical protein n=1 Tax=Variovorax sp. DAIF25 TaxID=3080983 RepID=UPI003D6BBFFB
MRYKIHEWIGLFGVQCCFPRWRSHGPIHNGNVVNGQLLFVNGTNVEGRKRVLHGLNGVSRLRVELRKHAFLPIEKPAFCRRRAMERQDKLRSGLVTVNRPQSDEILAGIH